MRLKSILLKGFETFDYESGVCLSRLQKRNVIIGPNNVGKSSIFRFLNLLRQALINLDENLKVDLTDFCRTADRLFWKGETNNIITFELEICEIDSGCYETLVQLPAIHENACRTLGELKLNDKKLILELIPCFKGDNQWLPHHMLGENGQRKYLDSNGKYDELKDGVYADDRRDSALATPYLDTAISIWKDWASELRFFDSVRTLNKSGRETGVDDGSKLIKQLFDLQTDSTSGYEEYKLKQLILSKVNELLVPSGSKAIEDFQVRGTVDNLLLEVRINQIPMPIESVGTGLSELFMACCWLALENTENRIYFLEEPETHLHPGLLRRYANFLASSSNLQLFFNTHSPVLMNDLKESDTIWLLRKTPKSNSIAELCGDYLTQHKAIDALGIRGSDLLQTNCAIWIEGPSDRIYINYWLKRYERVGQKNIVEGSDFTFIIYGGKLLTHYHAGDVSDVEEDSDGEQAIAMLGISRFSAIVVDRDLPPSSNSDIRAAKKKIRDSASLDSRHRLFITTVGREIENDLDPKFFLPAVAAALDIEADALNGLELTGEKRYPEEIAEFLGGTEAEQQKVIALIGRSKVKIAECLKSPKLFQNPTLPRYVSSLYNFIVSSRADFEPDENDEDNDQIE